MKKNILRILFICVLSFFSLGAVSQVIQDHIYMNINVSNDQELLNGNYMTYVKLCVGPDPVDVCTAVWDQSEYSVYYEDGNATLKIGPINADDFMNVSSPNFVIRVLSDSSAATPTYWYAFAPISPTPYAVISSEAHSVDWVNVYNQPFQNSSEDLAIKSLTVVSDIESAELKTTSILIDDDEDGTFTDITDYIASANEKVENNIQSYIGQINSELVESFDPITEDDVDNFVSNNNYVEYSNQLNFETVSLNTLIYSQVESDTTHIDWTQASKQTVSISGNTMDIEFSFDNPQGATTLLLIINYEIDILSIEWPANVKWQGGVEPPLTKGIGSKDIISFYYDGTDFLGIALLDFKGSE